MSKVVQDGNTRTAVRFIVQGRAVHPTQGASKWEDSPRRSGRHDDLYSAIAARETMEMLAKNEAHDKIVELTGKLYAAFDLTFEMRIVKRTLVATDEVVDEAATAPLDGTV